MRRLLENGANSSFVNQIVDEKVSIDDLIRRPPRSGQNAGAHVTLRCRCCASFMVPAVSLQGWDLSNENVLQLLENEMNAAAQQAYQAASLTAVSVQIKKPPE